MKNWIGGLVDEWMVSRTTENRPRRRSRPRPRILADQAEDEDEDESCAVLPITLCNWRRLVSVLQHAQAEEFGLANDDVDVEWAGGGDRIPRAVGGGRAFEDAEVWP